MDLLQSLRYTKGLSSEPFLIDLAASVCNPKTESSPDHDDLTVLAVKRVFLTHCWGFAVSFPRNFFQALFGSSLKLNSSYDLLFFW